MKGFENKKIDRPDKTGRREIMTFLWDLKLILGIEWGEESWTPPGVFSRFQ